jgi:hypothetical protein
VTVPHTMDSIDEQEYNQSHLPIHEQMTILGHSVRAFYLTTAAADVGGAFVDDARRLWDDAVGKKMYPTGGFGSEPRVSLLFGRWGGGSFLDLKKYPPLAVVRQDTDFGLETRPRTRSGKASRHTHTFSRHLQPKEGATPKPAPRSHV